MDIKRIAFRLATLPQIQWVRPSLHEEAEEISQQGRDLGIDPQLISRALAKGQIIPLTESLWANLLNTDSWDTRTMKAVQEKAAVYKKDLKSVCDGFLKGGVMAAPMVVRIPGIGEWLVGGNTRLMVCRALKIQPHILHGDMTL